MSMLEGDQFTVEQWAAAVKRPSSLSADLPAEVENALSALHEACKSAGIPILTVLCSGKSTHSHWDMGDQPHEVTGQYLMARATVAENAGHAMAVAPVVMRASGVKF